ncbi:MAG: hypothetical protein AAF805_09125 [Planctomycetota bacterium]
MPATRRTSLAAPARRGSLLAGPVVAAMALLVGAPVDAFWFGEFYNYCERRREENNRWPEQFVGQDRVNATAPFDIMIRNGWRRQNLLGAHHFSPDGTKLTEAGKLKVRWILTQPPTPYQQLFVERSLRDGETENRIAAANEFASVVVRDGLAAPAQETHLVSEGRPAPVVDFVNTQFRDNMRTPALPEDAGPAVTE